MLRDAARVLRGESGEEILDEAQVQRREEDVLRRRGGLLHNGRRLLRFGRQGRRFALPRVRPVVGSQFCFHGSRSGTRAF
jgi:hypothetical protein